MTQHSHDKQSNKPIITFKVLALVAYTWKQEDGIDTLRINDVSDWLIKCNGRRLSNNIYIFGKEGVPSYAEFKDAFSPLRDGEGIVVIAGLEERLKLDIYGQPSPVKDIKIIVTDKAK